MRRLVVAALTAAALGAGAAPAASDNLDLSYGCSPPLPPTAGQCYAWNTGPVTIAWDWNTLDAQAAAGSSCQTQTFFSDTPGLPVTCEIEDKAIPLMTNTRTAVIRIDATPPTVSGMQPARPPDHDGWWNHPVDLAFTGSDATSGLAGCDTVTYGGPDGADAPVSGRCHDQAGNTATRSFGLNYDATPPSITGLAVKPANRRVVLSWAASPDTVLTEVVRTPGVVGAPTSTLYSGSADTFTDSAVTNGKTYRYTIFGHDPAGNVASVASSAKPSTEYAISPASSARLRRPPLLRWPRVAKAGYYNVQLYRGKHKILSAWPTANHLRLHRTWKFHGHRQRLKAGHYRWFVWPGFGARAARHYGALIAQRGFYMDR